MASTASRRGVEASTATRWAMRLVSLGYLLFLLLLPVGIVFWRTFEGGVGPVWEALSSPSATHALTLTIKVAVVAVVANTIFGVTASLLVVRGRFPGRRILDAVLDLPLAVSPVVVGLALILVYGRNTAVGLWLAHNGMNIIFATP